MADAKVEVRFGNLTFSGEGSEAWVAKQLDKVLRKADGSVEMVQPPNGEGDGRIAKKPAGNLAAFLIAKNATTRQVRKFLATAVWLSARGSKTIATGDVVKALKANHQSRLGNPSDCLNKNVAKGLLEKNGKDFFVTEDGDKEIG